MQFIYLTDITAVHYPEREKPFAVVYHVHSLVHNVRIRIKVFLEKETHLFLQQQCYGTEQTGWNAKPTISLESISKAILI
ncbi:NADH dehydrogenase subunit C [Sphingobacterium daejeonense]|nr:NADH dehydrogenase subunit C [Sphingobacterium daejeonense]